MLSPSGPLSSQRYDNNILVERWTYEDNRTDCDVQALEGKDVKDLLLNVGSGGGAAAAPAAGGAAAGGAEAAAETKEEEKEEGMTTRSINSFKQLTYFHSQGRIRRGYGLRSFRLDYLWLFHLGTPQCNAMVKAMQHMAGRIAVIDKQSQSRCTTTQIFIYGACCSEIDEMHGLYTKYLEL